MEKEGIDGRFRKKRENKNMGKGLVIRVFFRNNSDPECERKQLTSLTRLPPWK